jgi:hypothetical protein
MPFYISTSKIPGPNIGHRQLYIPLGGDATGASWIWLGDAAALLWVDSALADAKLKPISDGKIETVISAARISLNNFLTDRTISSGSKFDAVVADLLQNPPVGRWNPLRPSKQRQQFEIWLGPKSDRLLWRSFQALSKNSKSIVDTFDRADSNLDGSTSSDTLFVWDEIQGTIFTILSNALVLDPPDASDYWCVALADYSMDTDDLYCQLDLVLTDVNGSHTFGEVGVRHTTGAFARNIYIFSNDSSLGSDSGTDSTTATIRIEADGSSIQGKVDGSVVLGPYTDTTHSSQVKTAVAAYAHELVGSILVSINNFAAGDLVVASIEQEGFRFRNDDGSESAATWKANQDTNITLAANTAFRLRELLNATGDPASISTQIEVRYKPSGGAFGSYTKVVN